MRLFAICCFAVASFFAYTAGDAMRTGTVQALGGDSGEYRRDDPQSKYRRYLLARWVYAGGFAALGCVMFVFAGRFEKLGEDAEK